MKAELKNGSAVQTLVTSYIIHTALNLINNVYLMDHGGRTFVNSNSIYKYTT